MSRKRTITPGEGAGERSEPEPSPGAAAARMPPAGTRPGTYTPQQKLATLVAYIASGVGMRVFCKRQGLSTATLCAWRRAYEQAGAAGLEPQRNPRNSKGRTRRAYSPEERRAAIESYLKSGLSMARFCALWGVSAGTLGKWLRVYRAKGPKALERPFVSGGKPGRPKKALPEAVKTEIAETKRDNPHFGLRRIRDVLARFRGVRVRVDQVREVVREEGLATPVKKRRRRGPDKVRRFERAKPNQMWQSDITSYVLARHSQRVYLTVFLDDHSRYVVSWALALEQRGALVTECLLAGISRYGKPVEVLTDQGRQYYAWRGKSAFQKLLRREGIEHVVSRAHHPMTLGKCERLWQTVGRELWDRARPQDLDEARRRMGHFFAHYNHFRPHQGIAGLVPADRFFGAESAAREAIERAMDESELDLALGEPPRRPVFLYGQIGERAVSLHGEQGRLVVQTPDGKREELSLESLRAAEVRDEREGDDRVSGDDNARHAQSEGASEAQAPHALQGGAASAPEHASAVGVGERGGEAHGPFPGERDSGILAGQGEPRGGGQDAGSGADPGVAAEPGGNSGSGVRTATAAPAPQGRVDGSRGRDQAARQADRGARERARGGQGPDRDPEDPAGQRWPGGELGCDEEREGDQAPLATRGDPEPRQALGAGSTQTKEGDSTPWWEETWGELFDAWERDGGRSG